MRTYVLLWYKKKKGVNVGHPRHKNVVWGSILCRLDWAVLAKSAIWLSGRHVADMSATLPLPAKLVLRVLLLVLLLVLVLILHQHLLNHLLFQLFVVYCYVLSVPMITNKENDDIVCGAARGVVLVCKGHRQGREM